MTDAKPVAELRREAHDACGLMLKAFKETGGGPMETIPLHIIIDALANRAEAAERALAEERRNFLLAENVLGDKK